MQKTRRPGKLLAVFGVVLTLATGAAVGAGTFFWLRQAEQHKHPGGHVPKCPAPKVRVAAGELLGLCRPENSRKGIPQYAAFLGVPYAKPPVGELRFKAPRPLEPWQGVRQAKEFDHRCLQGNADTQLGWEDCLHVNVYTRWLQEPHEEGKDLLPVIVHVHGGYMKEGSGNLIRPDYFVNQDLVVVTFNYRLGNVGFLSLDNDVAPGNAGLKDMVAALRWVRENIRAFGGDPDKVTVQGCSSAAAAVHWLTLLPDTEGLFRGAIIKSASAMTSWAYTDHRNFDFSRLVLDFLDIFSPNKTAAEKLERSGTSELLLSFMHSESARPKDRPGDIEPPTVALEARPDGEEPKLILKDAEAYILQPARSSMVPIMMGFTECEYNGYGDMFLLLGQLPPVESPLLERLIPSSAIPTDFAKQALGLNASYPYNFTDVADDFRSQLFNTSLYDTSCGFRCRWEQFFSGSLIKMDSARSMRMHAREAKAPVYAYYYTYPITGGCAMHAQDDWKVWPQDEQDLMMLNTTDPLALNVLRQVTLFSNFVKYGKPVPKTDDTLLPVEWTPMPATGGPDHFYRIDKNLTMETGDIMGDAFGSFWRGLYNKYRLGGDAI